MKNTITKKLNRISILVIVLSCIAFLGLCGGVTYAVYTAINEAKRVIYTQGGSDECFSSNYMTLTTKDASGVPGYSKITYPTSVSNPTIVVSVCNYPQGNMTLWNEEYIYYSFEVILVDSSNVPLTSSSQLLVGEETVTFGDYVSSYQLDSSSFVWDSTNSCYKATTEDHSLSPIDPNRNTHRIKIAKELIESGVSIWASAITTSSSSYAEYNLSGIIRSEYAIGATDTEWTMSITEEELVASNTVYGFNVILNGTVNKTVTLGYDSSKLIINPRFLEDLGEENYTETVEDTWKYYEFQVGGSASTYSIQFFYNDSSLALDWDTVKSWLVFPEK